MIKGVGKKIVLLNNTDSELFEQAIFILRSDEKQKREDLVKECERIMNLYMSGGRHQNKSNGWKKAFYLLLITSTLLMIALLLIII
ncbi:MAG: hypothetical protein IJN80_06095 [Clostridia bacterium]|nr:hypothetical protein [Clostridia bacterium]